MKSGTVKWFSKERGYGFLVADEGGDIFVHHSDSMGVLQNVQGK